MVLLAMLFGAQGCMPGSDANLVRAPAPAESVAVASAPAPLPSPSPPPDLPARLAALAPDADPDVLRLAVQAETCARDAGDTTPLPARLGVIDYSRPSTERRLWVFDLRRERLLYHEFVAHGRNTGDNLASRFSNAEGSLQSSLGLFRTAETYEGGNGYSLRMDGLEPGFNDQARSRAIVMHGAWYVDPLQALKQGRLGRSLGCPALRQPIAREVIDTLKGGQALFAYYPDRQWLSNSRLLGCGANERTLASRLAMHASVHTAAR